MKEVNPYSAPTTSASAHLGAKRRHRLITAAILGLVTALAGPAFLMGYYEYHGIGISFFAYVKFFGIAYLAPALFFLSVGLVVGELLSIRLPKLSNRSACVISSVIAVAIMLVGIALLLAHSLDFEVGPTAFAVPAFSVVCGAATAIISSTYLAIT